MTANVALTDSFDQWRVKTNEVVVMTQTDGMSNFIKVLDTTNSTSNTTGSIITAGGLGALKSVVIGENLTVHGNTVIDGDTTISGNLIFGDSDTDQVTFDADINSNMIPNTDMLFNLGSATVGWANTYTGHLNVEQSTTAGKPAISITAADTDQIAIDVTAAQVDANVLDIDANSLTVSNVIDIAAPTLTTGSALYIDSDSASTGIRNIVSIINNDPLATAATPLYVKQDSTLAAAKFDAQTTIIVPVGTTAQRGTAVQGGFRYNTTTNGYEGYTGSTWQSFLGVVDDDEDTKIIAETGYGADNDDLDFYTAGTQRLKIDQTGAITVGVDATGYDVTMFGDTADRYWKWDEGADAVLQRGTLTIGVDGTGHDVTFYGGTAGSKLTWSQGGDALLLTDSSPLQIGDSQDMQLYHNGSHSFITNAVGTLNIATLTSGVAVSIGHGTSETTIGQNLTVTGNLTINGTTTTINSTTLSVDDKEIEIGSVATPSDTTANLGGFRLKGATDKTILWTNSLDSWVYNQGITVGENGTGHDVVFYGDTTGRNVTWDQDQDALHLTDNVELKIGSHADGDMVLYHDGSNSHITNKTGALNIATATSGIAVNIGHGTSVTTIGDNLTVTDTLTELSMREMKTNISNMENMLPSVLQMQGVSFDWKKDEDKGLNHYGFIAEDVDKILPNLVSHDSEGKAQGIQYSKMTAVLLEAIKEQQVQIDELKSKIN